MKYMKSWADLKGGERNLMLQVCDSLHRGDSDYTANGNFILGMLVGFLLTSVVFMFALGI